MTALHMPAVVSVSSHDKVTMDDRKRSLAVGDGDEIAPRSKRLVKDENGQAMRMDAEKEKDVEVCLSRACEAAQGDVARLTGSDSNTKKTPSSGK